MKRIGGKEHGSEQGAVEEERIGLGLGLHPSLGRCSAPDDLVEELEAMEPAERRLVMEELSSRPDLWGEGEGGGYGY